MAWRASWGCFCVSCYPLTTCDQLTTDLKYLSAMSKWTTVSDSKTTLSESRKYINGWERILVRCMGNLKVDNARSCIESTSIDNVSTYCIMITPFWYTGTLLYRSNYTDYNYFSAWTTANMTQGILMGHTSLGPTKYQNVEVSSRGSKIITLSKLNMSCSSAPRNSLRNMFIYFSCSYYVSAVAVSYYSSYRSARLRTKSSWLSMKWFWSCVH